MRLFFVVLRVRPRTCQTLMVASGLQRKRYFCDPRGSKLMYFPMNFEVVLGMILKLALGCHFGSNGALFWDPLGANGG